MKNDWQDVGLVWCDREFNTPKLDDAAVDARVPAELGETYDKARKGFDRDAFFDIAMRFDAALDKLIDDTVLDTQEAIDTREAAMVALYATDEFRALGEHRAAIRRYRDWWEIQPEVIAHQRACDAELSARNARSFSRGPMNKPGVLLQVKVVATGERKILLVGHMNTQGHDGGCCESSALQDDDIVERCKVVWEENEASGAGS